MNVIAVDVGTSVVKAVRYDARGAESVVARRQVPLLRRRAGWAEQDMDAVWSAVVAVLQEVSAGADRIRFVAVTAQGDGCWLVDSDTRPVGPAILWCDGRASELVSAWSAEGMPPSVREHNGALVFPGSPGALLCWLSAHQPETIAAASFALSCGGWIMARLTGVTGAEVSDFSNPWIDPDTGAYSQEILALHGVTDLGHLLPPIIASTDTSFPILDASAAEAGLPAGTPVVQAPYDVPATVIGAGATEPGDGTAILGTALVSAITLGNYAESNPATGATIALGIEGRYLHFFPSLAGTEVLGWAARLLGTSDAARLVRMAGKSPPGARGLVALPFLSPAGERAPVVDTEARSALLNLTFAHTREDVARSLVEGLTMVIRECLDSGSRKPAELRVCGGGATSDFWCQLVADATGLVVTRAADTEVGARGAMITGSIALGEFGDLRTATREVVGRGATFAPDPAASSIYDALFTSFLEARNRPRSAS